jgi:hypothetical protein
MWLARDLGTTMNGIEYTPQKGESPFWAQAGSQAEFTYSMSPDVIAIVDLDLGHRSVTNDIENVLRKIEHYHQGPITAFKIMYRDSEGVWDGVDWDGKRASFFALREMTEERAREKLLDRKRTPKESP